MYIQQITIEAVMAILMSISLFALLKYVLEDKPSDEDKSAIVLNNEVQADSDINLHNVLIRTGEKQESSKMSE